MSVFMLFFYSHNDDAAPQKRVAIIIPNLLTWKMRPESINTEKVTN